MVETLGDEALEDVAQRNNPHDPVGGVHNDKPINPRFHEPLEDCLQRLRLFAGVDGLLLLRDVRESGALGPCTRGSPRRDC